MSTEWEEAHQSIAFILDPSQMLQLSQTKSSELRLAQSDARLSHQTLITKYDRGLACCAEHAVLKDSITFYHDSAERPGNDKVHVHRPRQ